MTQLTLTGGGRSAATKPLYWLTFDGSDDYITLPAGEGDSPSTGLFVEAWVRNLTLGAAESIIVCRGDNSYTQGYTLSIKPDVATNTLSVRLALKNPAYTTAQNFGYCAWSEDLPLYVAVGYDATAGAIYYFLQGVLLKTVTGLSGNLSYTGNNWTIGKMPANLWFMNGDLTQVRVSDVCRYTASYALPERLTADANTVALYSCEEGAGTALADNSVNGFDGTFKGAGEPAWGAVADLQTQHYGEELWAAALAMVPAISGTDIYLHRVNSREYHVFRKVHATGPYWAKYVYTDSAGASALLEINAIYTGVPDPATDAPATWTTDPATQLMDNITEMVLYGNISGGAVYGWGSVHGYETQDSEKWYVDGVEVTLGDGDWAHGSTVAFVAESHYTEPDTSDRVCDLKKTHTFSAATMYVQRDYELDWLMDWTLSKLYPLMCEPHIATLTTVTHKLGGTDLDMSAAGDTICDRSGAAACWNAANGAVLALWADWEKACRYHVVNRPYFIGVTDKLYWQRTAELGGALSGTTWTFSTRLMALDNCGNHIFKTT